jgi:hypothetical protein
MVKKNTWHRPSEEPNDKKKNLARAGRRPAIDRVINK